MPPVVVEDEPPVPVVVPVVPVDPAAPFVAVEPPAPVDDVVEPVMVRGAVVASSPPHAHAAKKRKERLARETKRGSARKCWR
jgi:hypothetical protein